MLTSVYLEGRLGELFGSEWELEIQTPNDALKLINANDPRLSAWLRQNVRTYAHYQVVVEYEDGRQEELTESTYPLNRRMKSVRFVPILAGSGKWGNAIIGAVIIVVGVVYGYFSGDWVNAANIIQYGSTTMFVGVVQGLTTRTPSANTQSAGSSESKSLNSYSFDSVDATVQQGSPIPIIYGRMMVGAQVISAGLVVEQLM